MPVSFVSSAVPAGATTTSFTITIPTVATNDILVLATTNGGATTNPDVADNDSGAWSRKTAATAKGQLFWRRATAATSGKTITAGGVTAFTNSCSGVLVVLRGALRTGDPFSNCTEEENIAGNETHAAFGVGGPAWVGIAICNGATNGDVNVTSVACTSPGSLTEGTEKLSTGGVDCACALFGASLSAGANTGAFTWAQTDLATTSIAFAVAQQVVGIPPMFRRPLRVWRGKR
jgi:hypothetical protein